LTVHGHRDGVTSLDVFTHGTGNGHVGRSEERRVGKESSNRVERDGGFRQVGIHTVATVGFSARWVTRSVFRLNLGVYVRILGQVRAGIVHVPVLAVGVYGGPVVLTVHSHSDGVTGLDVFTHGTGNGHVGLGLSLVDHIVTRDGVDGDGGFWQISVYTVATIGFSGSRVTSGIFRFHLGVYVRISRQLGTRNGHVPGLAIGINRRRVVLTIDRHGHGIAGLDVFTHGTGNGHVGLGLSLVDHVITGNGVDGDGSFRSVGINVVWTFCIGGSGVACFVLSRNLGVNFSVTQQ